MSSLYSKLLSIFIILSISACVPPKEDSVPSDETDVVEAPFGLPPQLSFVMDYSAMDSPSSKLVTRALGYYDYDGVPMSKVIQDYSSSVPSYATQGLFKVSNHNFAAARVAGWSLLTTVGMAIPTASFIKAFEVDPTSIGDGKWQWAYSVTAALKTYNARLIGKVVNDQVTWEMYLSRSDGEFTDVNWYSGAHNVAATSGSWTIRQRDNSTGDVSDFIKIDWERDLTAGTRNIRYTNMTNDGYIENGISADATFDAYFNIDNKDLPAVINIEWNTSDKSGRVRSSNVDRSDHFGHVDWNCWDTDTAVSPFSDVDCS
ncbi:MAG: hypothetical protein OEX19_14580 [Gammaproteobacteria bacterium]|nr:hypothetical protein [Gammaproteobacteria bacterium]